MCLLLREALTVGRISFHKDFHSNEMSDDEARRRVVDEMMNYCVVTEPPKTTFGKVCTTLKLCAPHLITVCSCNLTVTQDVHRQALWPTRRRRHRSPTGDDRLLQVLCAPHAHAPVRVVTDTLCPASAVQDPKYRSFRHDDYTTPQGFTNHPQPSTNLG